MSDGHLRRLHRAWRETETLDAACAYDEACRRVGETSEPRTELYDRLRAALAGAVLVLSCKPTDGIKPDRVRVHRLWIEEGHQPYSGWRYEAVHDFTHTFEHGRVLVQLRERILEARYTVSLDYRHDNGWPQNYGAETHYFPGDFNPTATSASGIGADELEAMIATLCHGEQPRRVGLPHST